eukprot:TRINITY_DN18917_c0_g1_i1.p1 TRINITY_DN18917_c0_g1~~TRINITY_DN18917_c0_g1_i1.p1  ORF type:complete len:431 (+),score=109.31 TRINITY_DN18917_c0_g1_i1:47-1339(+)
MNRSLLDPFRNNFPEIVEESLDYGAATTFAFNRRGTFLATGLTDGRCVIWDFDTRGIAKELIPKELSTAPANTYVGVTSVSWSRSSRKLLAASYDGQLRLFDVLGGEVERQIVFERPLMSVQMHPKLDDWCIVLPFKDLPPMLVNLTTAARSPLPSPESEQDERDDAPAKKGQQASVLVVVFGHRGERILSGSSKGLVTIIATQSLQVLHHFRIPGNSAVRNIVFTSNHKQMLINCTDRIRLYDDADWSTAQPETQIKFRAEFFDPVNKMSWKKCCFSSDNEYVIGGSAQKSHHIYVWAKDGGQLQKVLEGPKDAINDLMWHPMRPIIVSLAARDGSVFIWASNYAENWSAFAPDFTELEENVEYIEREDEFDEVDEELTHKRKREEEDELVDIEETTDCGGHTCFSDESDEEDRFFIPVVIPKDADVAL